jgi:hypothetical protein
MRHALTALVLAVLLLDATLSAQTWTEVRPPEAAVLTVSMPCAQTVWQTPRFIPATGTTGESTTHMGSCRLDGNETYYVGWVDYRPEFRPAAGAELKRNLDDFIAAVPGSVVLTSTGFTQQGLPGLEFTAELPSSATGRYLFTGRILMDGNRPLMWVAMTPFNQDRSANIGRFLTSFRVTRSAPGQVVLNEDFNRADPGWRTGPTPEGLSVIAAGVLLVGNQTSSPNSTLVTHSTLFTDVIVEADMMLLDGAEATWHGVVCRDTAAGENKFTIRSDGYYSLELWSAGVLMPGSVKPASHPAIRTGRGAVNRLRAECVGTRLRMLVNDTVVADVTDGTLRNGTVGLSVSSSQGESATVLIDNVRFIRP